MTVIFEDLYKAGSARLSLSGGWKATRVFFADNVIGNPDAIMYRAIISGQVPAMGTPHPTIPLIIVDEISAVSKGSRQVRITINYKPVNFGNSAVDEEAQTQISITGSVQTVRTNKQVLKGKEKLIILKYTYPPGLHPKGLPDGTVNEVVGTIDKQVPVIVATLSRRESKDPAQKAFDFVGTLNRKRFIGGKAGIWLCTRIAGTSQDSGQTYGTSYEFMRAEGGWNVDLAFSEPRTGEIPADVEDQPEALINVVSQFQADFGKLKLGPFVKR